MSGKDLQLGPLEMDVLGHVERQHPLTVSEVRERLTAEGRDLAYTTVMTVMTRLHEKGVLTRKKEGRQYLYSPAETKGRARGSVRDSVLGRVHKALFKSGQVAPIVRLLEDADELDADDLRELRKLVDQKLARLGKDPK